MYVLQESGVIPRDSSSPSNTDSPSPSSDPPVSIEATASSAGADTSSHLNSNAPAPSQSASSLAPFQPEDTPSPPLRHLLNETADILESPSATRATTFVLDSLFSQLIDNAIKTQAFKPPPPLQELPPSEDQLPHLADAPEPKSRLATILATLTRQAHTIASATLPNQYIAAMNAVHELEALSAIVYSSNFGVEEAIRGAGVAMPVAEAGPEEERDSTSRPVSMLSTSSAGDGEGIVGATLGLFNSVWGAVAGSGRTVRGAVGRVRP